MEIEEAKKQCELMRDYLHFEENREAIDTVLKTLAKYENQLDLDYVDRNYVSKEKIRAKIEELKQIQIPDEGCLDYQLRRHNYLINKIDVLQELLEEGE